MNNNFSKYSILDKFQVSRETLEDFEFFVEHLIKKNKEKNIISKGTVDNIRERHIIDSAQAIDFIDLNDNVCTDLGSGGGMPGIILAIMFKNLKSPMQFNLFEKSYHKSKFLKEVSSQLNLNTKIYNEDIFNSEKIITGTIIARAFKPLPAVLELIHAKFPNFKNLIFFMGKKGKLTLIEAFKKWEFEYKEKESLTNKDSFLMNIKNLKKKN